MNIRDAKQEIINTIRAYTAKNEWGEYAIPSLRQRPLLLIGPPGIGKTAVMEQAAGACGIGFVAYSMTHHTRQSAIGLPYIERRTFDGHECAVTEYTMSEIIASVFRHMEESGCREGLLFLDEINCVSETLAPAILQFLQQKTFGSHRLPEGWILAAAGNPEEYNKSVHEFDIATLDRLKYISVEADYAAWRPYALASGIHGSILSYLDMHPEQFYILEQTYSSRAFVTARGWEDLSCLILQYETLGLPVTAAVTGQYLHQEELARDFAGYYCWYASQKSIPIPDMLRGDESAARVCRELLQNASFEERLQFVHRALGCIGTALRDYEAQKRRLTLSAEFLEKLERHITNQVPENGLSLHSLTETFLAREREILAVRREHGLSSEQELSDMRQALFGLQESCYRFLSGEADGRGRFPAEGMDGCGRFPAEETDGCGRFSAGEADSCGRFLARLQAEHAARRESLSQAAERIRSMTEHGVALLAEQPGPEFTLFLASLRENALFSAFSRKYPCAAYEHSLGRLDFARREEELRRELQG